MKMHEKLAAGQPEPLNKVVIVSYNEETNEPVQLRFEHANGRRQAVFLTEHEAKVLYYRLGCILLEKE